MKKTIYGIICALCFILIIGVSGAIDTGSIDYTVGCIILGISIVVGFIDCLLLKLEVDRESNRIRKE